LVRQNTVRLGGVIPTFAMIEHAQVVESVVADCLSQAGAEPADLTAVAVSTRPGMKGSLTVGTDYAKYLCLKHRLPLIPVHHMEAHALTARLPGTAHPPSIEPAEHSSSTTVQFPFLVLLISGGHCLLALATDIDQFQVLGSSIDCSPGEILDKAARDLGLHTLPGLRDVAGGRAVELLAEQGGSEPPVHFPIPMRHHRDCRFSFTGLKAAVRDYAATERARLGLDCDQLLPNLGAVCAGLQYSLTKHLVERLQRGVEFLESHRDLQVGSLVVSGGVASNAAVRSGLDIAAHQLGLATVYPHPSLCTDNGVMVAWNGYERWRAGRGVVPWHQALEVAVQSRCPLGADLHQEVLAASIKCKWLKI